MTAKTYPAADALIRTAQPDFHWQSVDTLRYKADGEAPFRDVTRQVLFDLDSLGCQWRYFEVAAHGYTTLERHEHVHAVMILRGQGRCLLAREIRPVAALDLVEVPPNTWHQFRAGATEPLGFLCLVRQDRDRPRLPTNAELADLRTDPTIAAFLDGAP